MSKTTGWLKRWRWMPMLMIGLTVGGCASEETDEDITATRFNIDREPRNDSSTDEFTWDTPLDQAIAILRIHDFTEGDTSLRVYDGAGGLVLVAALNTMDSAYFSGEDMYFQRQTARGAAGRWRIVLGYGDFTGDYDLTLE